MQVAWRPNRMCCPVVFVQNPHACCRLPPFAVHFPIWKIQGGIPLVACISNLNCPLLRKRHWDHIFESTTGVYLGSHWCCHILVWPCHFASLSELYWNHGLEKCWCGIAVANEELSVLTILNPTVCVVVKWACPMWLLIMSLGCHNWNCWLNHAH